MKKLFLVLIAALTGVWLWSSRGLLKSLGALRLAAALPNAVKSRGFDIRIPVESGQWIPLTLKADLGPTLSDVVGYPLDAAAYSHFGGFNLSRVYSDFVNPDSSYYQAWVGAYVVFDDDAHEHFGFDDEGNPIQDETLAVLEADQRLVLGGSGCPHFFDDGRRVRLIGELSASQVESGGELWWRSDGNAESWSAYHRGSGNDGHWRSSAGYGRVPDDPSHPVDDFHPLTYVGSFWQRYSPEWRATCAKFYIYPEYAERDGRRVTKGEVLKSECEAIIDSISFEGPHSGPSLAFVDHPAKKEVSL
jgi:hypothetical protein